MVAGSELHELVLRTVEIYNRYRSPEATTKLLDLDNEGFTIEFEGPFCQGCGLQEYFEDFIYELKGLNNEVDAEIQGYEQTGYQSFKVRYAIKSNPPANDFDRKLFVEFLRERRLMLEDYEAFNACAKDVIRFHYRTWLFEKGVGK